MSKFSDELKVRTRTFGINVLRLVDKMEPAIGSQIVGRQLAKCATSIGANYVAACSARSRAEFVAKLGIVNEEADECVYWLETVKAVPYTTGAEVRSLLAEAIELRAIIGRSLGTTRRNDGR